jgi:hypothetical protein
MGVPAIDLYNPNQMPPTFDFHHEVGTAVVHLGRLQHGSAVSAAHYHRCKLILICSFQERDPLSLVLAAT